ncbi:MAG: TIGR04376 family protein [Cyanobacteria bacterium P01_H01_bin.15]
MGFFEELEDFLSARLDDYLAKNPELAQQVLAEQIQEHLTDTNTQIQGLQTEQTRLETEILQLAEDIKRWHQRVELARQAGEHDLAGRAQEREEQLLRNGSQLWGQMTGVKTRLAQSEMLREQLQAKLQELSQSVSRPEPSATSPPPLDDLDETFEQWEMNQELERLKRNL